MTGLHIPIQEQIWNDKYRFQPMARVGGLMPDADIDATWRRVAMALADSEIGPKLKAKWYSHFYQALRDFRFLPAGRILAGAGTGRNVTLFNCYVLGSIPDSMEGIFQSLKEAALTLQMGGGIGMDFSTLRPRGAHVKGVDAQASGPVSFMHCWDSMCRTIMSAGARRGAMMGTLRCDHPDIEEFIEVKRDGTLLRMFNLSVLITDNFMRAVRDDASWELKFDGVVYKTVKARPLWHRIVLGAYDCAEPGVIFIDRINNTNNLNYCETISATNPCAEQPLPPYGACLLGSINLAAFIYEPFTKYAALDLDMLEGVVQAAVRMMDNVVDVSKYPLPQQEMEAKSKRRLGLGITGLADALAMNRLHYGTQEARDLAAKWMGMIKSLAYNYSVELAKEKGQFPLYTPQYGQQYYSKDPLVGIRNSHLTSIAPTGTISLLAGNISSGVEPIFDFEYERKVLEADGSKRTEKVEDYAVRIYRQIHGKDATLPHYFYARAHDLTPKEHILMQAALQPHVDSSISKTINCPRDMKFEDFVQLYDDAFDNGVKCCSAFRPNDITGSILSSDSPSLKIEGMKEILDLVHEASGLKVNKAGDMEIGEKYATTIRPNGTGHPDVNQHSHYSDKPAPRLPILEGRTYKLLWPQSPHAIYVTINNHDGAPFEIFINSKNLEHYAWTVALTRMISAIFRRGGDISFVVEELKAVFDPKGGAWMAGEYVPSLLAAIGNVIDTHIGPNKKTGEEVALSEFVLKTHTKEKLDEWAKGPRTVMPIMCPKCTSNKVVCAPHCMTCLSCGHSTCE